jgi:hypothetical protein
MALHQLANKITTYPLLANKQNMFQQISANSNSESELMSFLIGRNT